MVHTHRYALIQRLSRERKQRLEESKKKFNLTREVNELDHWLNDREALAGAEESAKDLEHVEALKKKFDDFQKDVVGNEARLDNINSLAHGMIDEGHFDADEIQGLVEVSLPVYQSVNQSIDQSINQSIDRSIDQSINQSINRSINQSIDRSIDQSINQSINQSVCLDPQRLNQRWDDLTQLVEKKKKALEGSYQVQKFIR